MWNSASPESADFQIERGSRNESVWSYSIITHEQFIALEINGARHTLFVSEQLNTIFHLFFLSWRLWRQSVSPFCFFFLNIQYPDYTVPLNIQYPFFSFRNWFWVITFSILHFKKLRVSKIFTHRFTKKCGTKFKKMGTLISKLQLENNCITNFCSSGIFITLSLRIISNGFFLDWGLCSHG